jgi:hypothetical protein
MKIKTKPSKRPDAPSDAPARNWAFCKTCGGYLSREGETWVHTGQRPKHVPIPILDS